MVARNLTPQNHQNNKNNNNNNNHSVSLKQKFKKDS